MYPIHVSLDSCLNFICYVECNYAIMCYLMYELLLSKISSFICLSDRYKLVVTTVLIMVNYPCLVNLSRKVPNLHWFLFNVTELERTYKQTMK